MTTCSWPKEGGSDTFSRTIDLIAHFSIILSGKIRVTNEWLASRDWLGELGKDINKHPHV